LISTIYEFFIFKAYHVSEQDKTSKHIFFICERVYYTNTAPGAKILLFIMCMYIYFTFYISIYFFILDNSKIFAPGAVFV
jgi:hypothetical protein